MKRPYLYSALVSEESKQCEANVSLFSITGLSSLEKTLNSPMSETRLDTDILEHHTYEKPPKKDEEQSGPIGGQQAGSLAVGRRGRGTNDPKSFRSQHLDHWSSTSPLKIAWPHVGQTRAHKQTVNFL